jgi:hypothetical protein
VCEFVYEDDERFCDMDGSELVHDALSLPLPALAEATAEPAEAVAKSSRRSFAVPAIGGVLLAMVLTTGYYAAARGWLWKDANRPIAKAPVTAPALPQLSPEPAPANEETPSGPEGAPAELSSSLPQLPKPATNAPLSSGPVAATGSGQRGRGPVIIRLTNGAAIKADEAWEKREGIWYRQAGVVTFLKRNRARTIERLTPPPPAAAAPHDMKARPKSSERKPESRVSSILKTTGRILKRPFRF